METPATTTPTPSDDVRYVFFGMWTQARHWAREHGIREKQIISANAGPRGVRGHAHRLVFVEVEDFYPGRQNYDTWRVVAEIGRHSNEANGFETEIIHV